MDNPDREEASSPSSGRQSKIAVCGVPGCRRIGWTLIFSPSTGHDRPIEQLCPDHFDRFFRPTSNGYIDTLELALSHGRCQTGGCRTSATVLMLDEDGIATVRCPACADKLQSRPTMPDKAASRPRTAWTIIPAVITVAWLGLTTVFVDRSSGQSWLFAMLAAAALAIMLWASAHSVGRHRTGGAFRVISTLLLIAMPLYKTVTVGPAPASGVMAAALTGINTAAALCVVERYVGFRTGRAPFLTVWSRAIHDRMGARSHGVARSLRRHGTAQRAGTGHRHRRFDGSGPT